MYTSSYMCCLVFVARILLRVTLTCYPGLSAPMGVSVSVASEVNGLANLVKDVKAVMSGCYICFCL